ncbi:MAG: HyaD/HybD family hydrogenase maturation endopeptidase [Desulfobacteraceae bacterium]|nr:HyaD/HybD family hydrogenase maturation endopeptidase [Desulfobacteraceae bacterium]
MDDASERNKRILVLGVGNILLRDEGIGVKTVQRLQADYRFSENVELMDGGTLGLRLLDPIAGADALIVVDAVQNGEPPGTLHRLTMDVLENRLSFRNSLHELDMVQCLAYADMLGNRPETVILGIEPADISPWGTELTEVVESRMEELCRQVLEEIERAGGSYAPVCGGEHPGP